MKKMIEYLWYVVIVTVIWGTGLGGVKIGSLGTMSPFRIIIIILAVILCFQKFKNREKIKKTNIILFIVSMIVLIYNLFFLLNSNESTNTIQKILNFGYGILLIILGKDIIVENRIFINTIKVILVNFIIIVIWGFYESFSGNYIFPVNALNGLRLNSFGLYPPVVTFFNTNGLAVFCIMMLPIIYSIPISKNKTFSVILKSLLVITSMILSLFAGARAVCILILAFIVVRLIWKIKDRKKAVFIVLTIAILMVARATVWKEQVDKLASEIFSINLKDDSTMVRANVIMNGLEKLEKSNFLGIGMGNFEVAMQKYNNTQGIVSSHNLVVETLVENGIIIFTIIAVIFLNMIIKLIKKYIRQNQYGKNFMINILFLSITFPISTSINSTTYAFMPMWIMIMIFSVLVNNDIMEFRKEGEKYEKNENKTCNH